MLYFFAVWILLLVVCSIVGTGMLSLLRVAPFERRGDRWILSEWVGIIILSIALLAVSIVLPLNSLIGAVVVLTLCALSLALAQTRSEVIAFIEALSRQKIICGLALALVIATITTQEVTWWDSGLYHYSSIQWLNQFGTVKGLSLLYGNLGFTSAWFALAAPFNPAILEARVSAVGTGFAFLLIALHFCGCVHHLVKGKGDISHWFFAAFSCLLLSATLLLPVARTILISPSPDLPVTLLVGTTAWAMLLTSSSPQPPSTGLNRAIVPLILATGAVSLKLIGLPIFLIASLFFLVNCRLQIWQLLTAAGIVTVLLLPFLVVNVLTSACLLYPSTVVCFDLPWKNNAEMLQQIAQETHNWATWYPAAPPGIHPWLWSVWLWLQEGNSRRIMALFIGLSAIVSVYVVKIARQQRHYALLWPVAISAIGIPFFMITALVNRFLMAYLLMLPSFAIGLYLRQQLQQDRSGFIQSILLRVPKHQPLMFSFAPLFLTALLTVGSLRSDVLRLLMPPRMQQVPVVETQINDISYWLPLNKELCWATNIPCAYGITQDITFRDPAQGYRAGFMQKDPA